MEVSYNNLNDKIRLSQLTQKTNQFNFTTKRYSELDIENFIKKMILMFLLEALKISLEITAR